MTATAPPTWQPDWQQEPPSKPLWRQKKVAIPASIVGGFLALGILGAVVGPAPETTVETVSATSAAAEQAAADRAAAEAAAVQAEADRAAAEKIAAEAAAAEAAAQKAAAEQAAAEQKAAADKAAADKAAADKAAADKAAADAAAAAPMVDFVMPNLVGANLQVAQDTVQTSGIFFSTSHDLLGMRSQMLDSNWQVCDQTPAAGTRISGPAGDWEGRIDFGAVKLTETCP